MMCENFSLTHICKFCQETFLKPSLYKRRLPNGVAVISFYKYSEIKELIHTKHTDLGYHIYNILASLSFKIFAQSFKMQETIVSIPIDDRVTENYAHTAILNKHLNSKSIKAKYSKLHATNTISYSGKSREFRLKNPRNFQLKHFKDKKIILVDDIITTGSTLTQAVKILEKNGKEVLLCLTLCDVSRS